MNRDIMLALGMDVEIARIDAGKCPMCNEVVGEFKNDLARQEFEISFMCQKCQDFTFNDGEPVEIQDDDDESQECEDDGQPTEYQEWQDFMGGDDWDHGQCDES